MPRNPARKAIHGYMADSAFEGWHAHAAHHGVTVSGLLGAIGDALALNPDVIAIDDLVGQARAIDAHNRRRRT